MSSLSLQVKAQPAAQWQSQVAQDPGGSRRESGEARGPQRTSRTSWASSRGQPQKRRGQEGQKAGTGEGSGQDHATPTPAGFQALTSRQYRPRWFRKTWWGTTPHCVRTDRHHWPLVPGSGHNRKAPTTSLRSRASAQGLGTDSRLTLGPLVRSQPQAA